MEVTERGGEICPHAVNRGRVGPLLRRVPMQLPFQNWDSLVLRGFVLYSSNEGWKFLLPMTTAYQVRCGYDNLCMAW